MIARSIGVAITRPSGQQLATLLENVRTSVGALHRSADLMPHGLLNHGMHCLGRVRRQ